MNASMSRATGAAAEGVKLEFIGPGGPAFLQLKEIPGGPGTFRSFQGAPRAQGRISG